MLAALLFLAPALAQTTGHSTLVERTELVEASARTGAVTTVVLHSTGGDACDPAIAYKSGTLDGIVKYFSSLTDCIGIHEPSRPSSPRARPWPVGPWAAARR